jgi:hypothetical protein
MDERTYRWTLGQTDGRKDRHMDNMTETWTIGQKLGQIKDKRTNMLVDRQQDIRQRYDG